MSVNFEDALSVYDFTVKDLHDKDFKLSKFDNNQVLLVVNFATNDELADKNFLELKSLKQKYCDDIKILLFPCCQFGELMSERDNSELYCWCKFDGISEFAEVFSLIDVNGANAHPLYKFFTQQKPGGIEWNFVKFLVDKRGNVVERFSHNTSFYKIENAVKTLL